MKIIQQSITIITLMLVISSCRPSDPDLETGAWRATLKTETAAEIPFNFEVIDSAGVKRINIINGKENFRVDEISFDEDSIFIQMPLFDSEIRARLKGNLLSGNWILHLADKDVFMTFLAKHGDEWRFFKANKSSELSIAGKWSVAFTTIDGADTTIAVGEFVEENERLTGTFLTSTGDYRYLEGTVSDDNLYLSSFDGGSAYLFTGKLLNDSTLIDGKFYSGYKSLKNWTARKDDKAILPDAYTLTSLKDGFSKIDFSFPNLSGKKVSLSDNKFKDKIVLVQFFGSWCPNCMDETAYLADFYSRYKDKGVEIVGLAYERTAEFERSKKNVQRLKDRFNVPYDMLITGYTKENGEVSKSLPMLDNFVAFPTLIVIDKAGVVSKIHTGFSGPGTGGHYTEFVKEFERTIDDLLAEN